MTTTTETRTACPHCGAAHDAATSLRGNHTPSAGALTVCFHCAGLSRFTREMTLEACEVPADANPATRALLERAREAVRATAYGKCASRLDELLASFLARGKAPRFALPALADVGVIGALDEAGKVLARNADAREFVEAACAQESAARAPTILMLQAALLKRGVPFDRVSLSELGLLQLAIADAVERLRPGFPPAFVPRVAVLCPLCPAGAPRVYVAGYEGKGEEPVVFHEKPPCAAFEELEICDFLERARAVLTSGAVS